MSNALPKKPSFLETSFAFAFVVALVIAPVRPELSVILLGALLALVLFMIALRHD